MAAGTAGLTAAAMGLGWVVGFGLQQQGCVQVGLLKRSGVRLVDVVPDMGAFGWLFNSHDVRLVFIEAESGVFGLATGVFGLTNLPRGCVWCRGLAARGAFGLSENAKGAFGLAQDQ
ncbi:hypothetical protein Tco_1280691, partial [Tanacetum coccineum]